MIIGNVLNGEYIRTGLFKGHSFEMESIKEMYPFYLSSFPSKAYKSHSLKVRELGRNFRANTEIGKMIFLFHIWGLMRKLTWDFIKGSYLVTKQE